MTSRTLTAAQAGPVHLHLHLPVGTITVTAQPGCERATLTLATTTDDPVFTKAVTRADMDATAATLRVKVDDLPPTVISTTSSSGRQTNFFAGGIVMSGSGNVTVNGRTIRSSGPVTIVNGQVIEGGTDGVAVGSLKLDATVPEGCHLTVTGNADLHADGEYDKITVRNTSGDATLGGVKELRFDSTSGDVNVEAVDTSAEIRTVSGDICLDRADRVSASSTSGDIAIRDFGGTASLNTVSGDVAVHATEGGQIQARSISGDVHVTATSTAVTEGLHVQATSQCGTVRTPSTPAGSASRPRRPRRTTTSS